MNVLPSAWVQRFFAGSILPLLCFRFFASFFFSSDFFFASSTRLAIVFARGAFFIAFFVAMVVAMVTVNIVTRKVPW